MGHPQKAMPPGSDEPEQTTSLKEALGRPPPDLHFEEAQDVPAPGKKEGGMPKASSTTQEEPSESELRGRILNAIPLKDDESATSRTEKVMAVCGRILRIQYEEAQPLVQAGLAIALDHWAHIHHRLEEGTPVGVEEACRAARAIDDMLAMAPAGSWQATRKVNRDHLYELQGTEDGLIEKGPLKERCLRGFELMIHEGEHEKQVHGLFLKECAEPFSEEEFESKQELDIEIARRHSRAILDDSQIQPTPPGKRERLPNQPQAAHAR